MAGSRPCALTVTLLCAATASAQRIPLRSRSHPAPVTFTGQVVRLFQKHCQGCHRPGDIAPFSLLTYSDARVQARRIKTAVQTRQMPPWKPVPGYGEFQDENRLAQEEIDLISRWVDTGAPEGDPQDLPAPVPFSEQWALGTPDLVLEPDADFAVPAEGPDVYRCFSIPTRLLESRWVSGFDVRPGNRGVVHHVLVYPDPLGLSALKRQEDGPGYGCFGGPGIPAINVVGAWVPGMRPRMLPEGIGVRLTPFGRVVVQVHYHRNGTAASDRTRVGLYFARNPARKELYFIPLINTRFVIPPGAERYLVTASFSIPEILMVEAVSIIPHMHMLGREIRVDAYYPDGSSRPLIYIDDWDFDWQAFYYYRQPVDLPPGTRLELRAVYDNSSNNPRNPFDPPREVRWGEESTDEMCLAFVGVVQK